ncbi:transporter [Formosa sp. PL04]|uniref:transporter n=1 Tax=Formosa sp. PL04 TaxID=3081755 RepID=UPI002982067E|nr:transporter [Formosa sp. PL04]MDW5288367.1 transporter [Formosa sp. PL04]
MKTYLALIICTIPVFVFGQYTEVINSNRPGVSQSAYSVGVNVIQLEAGPYYIKEEHALYDYDVKGGGVDFAVRYGLLWEPLEIMVDGTFQADTYTKYTPTEYDYSRSNFKNLSVGAKYLIYDPNKNAGEDKPNLYNWKANHKIKWSRFIPAVSIYAGANYDTELNAYTPLGIEGFSPKVVLITQQNFASGWVFVMNLAKSRIGLKDSNDLDASDFQYIFTLTHGFSEKWVAFGEYQGIKSNFYADDLFRLGGAYLLNKNLQLDTAVTFNVKDTPTVLSFNFGASYRMDLHKDKEVEGSKGTSAKEEAERRDSNDYYKFGEDEKEGSAPTEYKMND